VRVFVAGASGAIGRPLVRRLVAAGHEVTGISRSREGADAIARQGARGLVCDVFDREELGRALMESSADVVVHQLTALPHALDPRRKGVYDATNRLRTEGTRLLIEAGRAAGAGRIVAQSIAFQYAAEGDWVKDESAPVMSGFPGPFGSALAALAELEAQVLGAKGMRGLVLRYGYFYGPQTSYAGDGHWAGEARRRRLPVIGGGDGVYSFVHTEDAAAATVAAVERGAPGVYNVVDDDPARMGYWVPAFADAVGAPRPLRLPAWIAKLVAGRGTVELLTRMRGASNAKARSELGWEPIVTSWRRGFREYLDRAPGIRE
jgi:nucleoside-diphosphate-sugar epimerase